MRGLLVLNTIVQKSESEVLICRRVLVCLTKQLSCLIEEK